MSLYFSHITQFFKIKVSLNTIPNCDLNSTG